MARKRCILLIPIAFNDGTEVPGALIMSILREIDERFDGHYVAGTGRGTYRMSNGTMAEDDCLQVWVAVEEGSVGILEKMTKSFARRLKQETMYFEVMDSEVRFIEPEPTDSGAE